MLPVCSENWVGRVRLRRCPEFAANKPGSSRSSSPSGRKPPSGVATGRNHPATNFLRRTGQESTRSSTLGSVLLDATELQLESLTRLLHGSAHGRVMGALCVDH